MGFYVIDKRTGKDISEDQIDKIAKEGELMEMDIDQFFIGEDGTLALADDCGRLTYCNDDNLMVVRTGRYPDLEYFEAILLGNIKAKHPEYFEDPLAFHVVDVVAMFPQTWPSTAGGLWEPGTMAGQAFTTQITTVMQAEIPSLNVKCYGVFFGHEPAYCIEHANDQFINDLKHQSLRSKYEASLVY